MLSIRRPIRAVAASLVGLATVSCAFLSAVPMAQAGPVNTPAATGYDGVCKGADALTGTTVVIDFQDLGGKALVRCSPQKGTEPRTGIQALTDAGIKVEGVGAWGLGFVCRLADKPGTNQVVPIPDKPNYKEKCEKTPPAAAYWSYWLADGTGADWSYSPAGALNRTVIPGGFEGWSFSHNATETTNPKPGFVPKNPAVATSDPVVSLMHDDLDRTIKLGESVNFIWAARNVATLSIIAAPTAGSGLKQSSIPLSSGGSFKITPEKRGTYTYVLIGKAKEKTISASVVLTVK